MTKRSGMRIAVVGAGVTGALVARELMRYKAEIVLLEKGADVAEGASKANSGIVHAGHDAVPGTNKAKFNVQGNRMMPEVCRQLGVRYRNNGSLVLAFGPDDLETLRALYRRGRENGVEVSILDGDAVRALEPAVGAACTAALYAPAGGIVCPYGLTVAAVGNAMDNGARLETGFEVTAVEKTGRGFLLHAADGRAVKADVVVNCAGLSAAKLARMVGDDSFTIGARRGQYLLYDNRFGAFVEHTLFACPTAAGKGVLITPTVDGNLMVGPTSEEGQAETATTAEGLKTVAEKAAAMVDGLPKDVITSFAGVRAFCDRNDFIIGFSPVENVYTVAGIESPGLTAAPAVGQYVARELAAKYRLEDDAAFDPQRQPETFFRDMSRAEKNAYIAQHPEFGQIVCRCESVTLGELRHAARQNPPAKTVDALKRRTRAGMGRCQGGFCQPGVVELLIEEFGLEPQAVTKLGGASKLIVGETK